jgi:hypothetical protein
MQFPKQVCTPKNRYVKVHSKYIGGTYQVYISTRAVPTWYVHSTYQGHSYTPGYSAMSLAIQCYVTVTAPSQSLLQSVQSPPVFQVHTKGTCNRSLTYLVWQSAALVRTLL